MSKQGFFARRPWLLAVIIAGAVVLWMASGALGPAASPPAAAGGDKTNDMQRVQVRQQEAEWVTRYVSLYGRTEPARSVELKAETSGRVTAIGAERGQRVAAGDLLLRLDERDREARLAEARATVRQREINYEAQKRLKTEGYISESLLAEGAAQLEKARAELRRAELDLDYMSVRAPFDGALQERRVEIGDYVAPSDPVALFVDDRRLVVTAFIAEHDVEAVRSQAEGEARLVTGETVRGRIRYVAPVAEEATRTFKVEMELDNSAGNIPAGVTAELRIPAGRVLAHRLPPSLLTLDDDGTLGVKVVDASERVRFYPADVVKSGSDGVWVAGLPGAARVITVGQGFVKAGDQVAAVSSPSSEPVRTAETEE